MTAPAALCVVLAALAGAGEAGLEREALLGGTHWRLSTLDRGAVHAWRPGGWDARTAGVVVYVHGYYTDVDEAWRDYRLVDQFHASRRNALFVAPSAPAGGGAPLRWEDIDELLLELARAGVPVPAGRAVAIGHSGAYRTIASWLTASRLDEIVLLDGFYGREDELFDWLTQEPGHALRRLVLVGSETSERGERFLGGLRDAAGRANVPDALSGFTRRERDARALVVRSQYGHVEIVASGRVLPVLLERTRLPSLRAPRRR